MNKITYSEFRSELKKNFEKVATTGKPIVVSNQNHDKVVILSEVEYNQLIGNNTTPKYRTLPSKVSSF